MSAGFDRVRPRTPRPKPRIASAGDPGPDVEGKRALFSTADTDNAPATGSVTVECSACGQRTVLSPAQAMRAMVPSVHLPLVKRGHPSWLRCPACRQRTWVRLTIRL